ncbi:MAG TPA: purine-nucleoside phosphorylase [Ktedonobacterales bacterium]
MSTVPSYDEMMSAAEMIAQRIPERPRAAVILGSGLGGVADALSDPVTIPYHEIPGFPIPTVPGHAGELVIGKAGEVPVAAMRGRFHLYEGYSPQQVTFPVRVLRQLGADVLIVTAAAGGLNAEFSPGTFMALVDHIGLPLLAGLNPLLGPNDERLGERFPALTGAYDAELRGQLHTIALRHGIPITNGVYIMLSGPTFETPAELQMLRGFGADAVGMSTVPEVAVARHMGMRVLAVCVITNAALRDSQLNIPAEHKEVLDVAAQAGPQLATILVDLLRDL